MKPQRRQPSTSTDLQNSLVNLYQQANPSVVYIIVPPLGSGSGFVFNDEGYIVTNNHVVDGGSSFEVVFADGSRLDAELIGADVDSDLAVIKVDQLPDGVSCPASGRSRQPASRPVRGRDWQSFWRARLDVDGHRQRIGPQFAFTAAVGRRQFLYIARSHPDRCAHQSRQFRRAAAESGWRSRGHQFGHCYDHRHQQRRGFFHSGSAVHRIVPSLIEDGVYQYSYMGAGFDNEVSLDELAIYGLSQTEGAYVLNVEPDSPAAEAGLMAANPNTGRDGDLIVAIDGQSIQNFSDLNGYLVFQHNRWGND